MGEIIFISPISLLHLSRHPSCSLQVIYTRIRRGDGSVMGEMTGEVKGEMKMAKTLYLKGLEPSDGRDEAFFR